MSAEETALLPSNGVTRSFPVASGGDIVGQIRRTMGGRWWAVLLLVVVLAASAATGLISPLAVGQVVDLISAGEPDREQLLLWAVMIGVAAALGAALTGWSTITASRLCERIVAQLRELMVARIFNLSQRTVETTGSGDLISRATNDVSEISQALPCIVPAATRSFFTIVVTLLGMAAVDWRYALAVLVVVPVHVLALRWYLRSAPQIYATQRKQMAVYAHHLLTTLYGMETVHAYRLNARQGRRISEASWTASRWEVLARIVQNRFFGRLTVAEVLGVTALLVTGFLLVNLEMGTVGQATTAILLFIRLFNPINGLLFVFDDLQAALASLARIVGVISMQDPSARKDDDLAETPQTHIGNEAIVALDDVHFSYGSRPVLQGVSLRIRNGETVALVGSSGAGKIHRSGGDLRHLRTRVGTGAVREPSGIGEFGAPCGYGRSGDPYLRWHTPGEPYSHLS